MKFRNFARCATTRYLRGEDRAMHTYARLNAMRVQTVRILPEGTTIVLSNGSGRIWASSMWGLVYRTQVSKARGEIQ